MHREAPEIKRNIESLQYAKNDKIENVEGSVW
jgi:hypothetical protein